jgi:hypothetical protein
MKHSIELFNSNRNYSFASETVDGSSPLLYMGAIFGGSMGSILATIPADMYGINWPVYVAGPLVALLWFFAWFWMPRHHVHYGMSSAQIETHDRFIALPYEVQVELGGEDAILEVIRAADGAELHQLRVQMNKLSEEWTARKRALARVAPERDQVAGYLANMREITSKVKTERETYEEML